MTDVAGSKVMDVAVFGAGASAGFTRPISARQPGVRLKYVVDVNRKRRLRLPRCTALR